MDRKRPDEVESDIGDEHVRQANLALSLEKFSNAWSVNPNSPTTQNLVGTVASNLQETNALTQKMQEDQAKEQERLMQKKPPEMDSLELPEDGDSPLPTKPKPQ